MDKKPTYYCPYSKTRSVQCDRCTPCIECKVFYPDTMDKIFTTHNSDYTKLPSLDSLISFMHKDKYLPNIVGTYQAIKRLGNFA